MEFDSCINSIVCGDNREVTKDWPNESVNCSISSPPYWALRDYGWDTVIVWGSMDDFVPPRKKQGRWLIRLKWRAWERSGVFSPNKKTWIGALGLEPTFEMYLDHLCGYYDEIKRILRKDGTCFVNLGDTYGGSTGQPNAPKLNPKQVDEHKSASRVKEYLPAKSLCLIPQRFAIEMVNRGWILRNVIIWSKPNPMPSSAKDRFTVDFEYVFFFVKSQRYFFEPQYEPYLTESNAERPRMGQGQNTKYKQKRDYGGGGSSFLGHSGTLKADGSQIQNNPLGRNKRTTWIIPTQATPDAHFATFPEDLVRPMVKAGCPGYVCKKCGRPRVKIMEPSEEYKKHLGGKGFSSKNWYEVGGGKTKAQNYLSLTADYRFKGYSDCGCGAGFRPGVMLDPFAGLAVPARWRPRRGWITSELILRRSMLRNSQSRMLEKLIPAYQ